MPLQPQASGDVQTVDIDLHGSTSPDKLYKKESLGGVQPQSRVMSSKLR